MSRFESCGQVPFVLDSERFRELQTFFPKTEKDIYPGCRILEIQRAECDRSVCCLNGDGTSVLAKPITSSRKAIFRSMHPSANSRPPGTFCPPKEEPHPMTAVAICPFGSSFLVAGQHVGLKLGNRDSGKVLFVGRPCDGPPELFSCFVSPVPDFGPEKSEHDQCAETE